MKGLFIFGYIKWLSVTETCSLMRINTHTHTQTHGWMLFAVFGLKTLASRTSAQALCYTKDEGAQRS